MSYANVKGLGTQHTRGPRDRHGEHASRGRTTRKTLRGRGKPVVQHCRKCKAEHDGRGCAKCKTAVSA